MTMSMPLHSKNCCGATTTNCFSCPSDFENPYAPILYEADDGFPQYAAETRAAYDSVEEIADNEVLNLCNCLWNLRAVAHFSLLQH